MKFCYDLVSNYGFALILFTLITKIILYPVSLWAHDNSLRLLKLQPKLNFIKARYYSDKEKISNEQLKLYKEEKYHPLVGVVPMLLQLVILMFVIEIIYNPLTYIIQYDSATVKTIVDSAVAAFGLDPEANSLQLSVVKVIQEGFAVDGVDLAPVRALNMSFMGLDLAAIPLKSSGIVKAMPLFTGLSALILSLFQNKFNPLQANQSFSEKAMTNSVSIGISLFLGGFVPVGVGMYWIFSNLSAMLIQLLLNVTIKPRKRVDYDELERSKEELEKIKNYTKSNAAPKIGEENYKREKADYKRFFSVANKHFVIYSENNGFYKYFSETIDYILNNSNIVIHYVTSDPNDNVFNLAKENDRIKAYYIGEKKLITLFMKMDADIVLMTMPGLGNYQYKRSYVKKDIEYVYLCHGIVSLHMVTEKDYFNNYDTVLCVGQHQIDELRRIEELYKLPKKKLVPCGYGQLEMMERSYNKTEHKANAKPQVMIAPSWQEDNILDSCLDSLLEELFDRGYKIIVRPHPEYVKRYGERLSSIVEKYKEHDSDELVFELDFSSNETVYSSDVLITDWSGISLEYSFSTLKPCLFVNTPPKILNPDYEKVGLEPCEIATRNVIGKSFEMNSFDGMSDLIDDMVSNKGEYADKILEARNKYVFNFGESGKVSGSYIIKSLVEKQKKNK